MKRLSFAATLLLTASVAVGQSYNLIIRPVPIKQDITKMTATVNAWKVFPGNPVCNPQTLEFGKLDNSHSCIGTDGYVYRYDFPTKTWIKQTAMGTPSYIAVVNFAGSSTPANIYALIRTATCNGWGNLGGQTWYGIFHWNPSSIQWDHPNPTACAIGISADYKGNLYAVGWDSNNQITALFQSHDGANSWQFWSDSWKFINMLDNQEGCAITNASSIWEVFTSGAPSSFPTLPSGTAAGCTVVENPFAMMAWNTAGQVYVIVDGLSTWQAVTGVNLKRAEGLTGYYIFGEDSSGKPYHWNVNAPGTTATYGGQWTGGCPSPGAPCIGNITHTLHHSLYFNTCHGINGCAESKSTQAWNANFAVTHSDFNPQCDPFFGGGVNDPECQITESAYGHCDASGATLSCLNSQNPQCSSNYVVSDSIDVTDYTSNNTITGPLRVQTQMYQGYYTATVENNITDGCYVSDPVPACPASFPYAEIDLKREWVGGINDEALAHQRINNDIAISNFGGDSPYVYRSFFIAEENPDGSLSNVTCIPPTDTNDTPSYGLFGHYDLQPHCH